MSLNSTDTDSLRSEHTVTHDDATWILTSAFIIFTMQSGKWVVFYPILVVAVMKMVGEYTNVFRN